MVRIGAEEAVLQRGVKSGVISCSMDVANDNGDESGASRKEGARG